MLIKNKFQKEFCSKIQKNSKFFKLIYEKISEIIEKNLSPIILHSFLYKVEFRLFLMIEELIKDLSHGLIN